MTIEGASAPSLDNWHMPRHLTWRGAVEPRIIRHLDLSPERTKTRTLVEGQRGRVIEGAGVQPDAFDRPRPRDVKRTVHQPAAGARSDQFCRHAEHADFALARPAKIQFEQSFVTPIIDQRIDFELRCVKPFRQFGVGHPDPREPEPLLTDAAIEIAKPVETG